MEDIYKISNITSDQIIFSCIRKSDNKVCDIHKLIVDRRYKKRVEKQTTCIVNQAEYEEIQKYGYFHVFDDKDLVE